MFKKKHLTMHSQTVNDAAILEYNVAKEIVIYSMYEGESCNDEGPPKPFTAGGGEDGFFLVIPCDNKTVANEKLLKSFLTIAREPISQGFLLNTTCDNSSTIHMDQETGRQRRIEEDALPTNTVLKPRTRDAEDAKLDKTCTETSTSREATSKIVGPRCASCVWLMEAIGELTTEIDLHKQTNENMMITLRLQHERNEKTTVKLRMQIEVNEKMTNKLELLTEQNE